eukprot:TRINITY_DN52322_c1_g2_i1.p1 TRINITY_DN52322_c1_g2~~TRINITY_DN52322_c1_g2_i1.p1  ORF type:complete len:454 (-),score=176.34 TRINITY_DN52322_c1_g2_i1:142-1422(-)
MEQEQRHAEASQRETAALAAAAAATDDVSDSGDENDRQEANARRKRFDSFDSPRHKTRVLAHRQPLQKILNAEDSGPKKRRKQKENRKNTVGSAESSASQDDFDSFSSLAPGQVAVNYNPGDVAGGDASQQTPVHQMHHLAYHYEHLQQASHEEAATLGSHVRAPSNPLALPTVQSGDVHRRQHVRASSEMPSVPKLQIDPRSFVPSTDIRVPFSPRRSPFSTFDASLKVPSASRQKRAPRRVTMRTTLRRGHRSANKNDKRNHNMFSAALQAARQDARSGAAKQDANKRKSSAAAARRPSPPAAQVKVDGNVVRVPSAPRTRRAPGHRRTSSSASNSSASGRAGSAGSAGLRERRRTTALRRSAAHDKRRSASAGDRSTASVSPFLPATLSVSVQPLDSVPERSQRSPSLTSSRAALRKRRRKRE